MLMLAVLVYLDRGNLLWVVFTAALLHELGHLSALFLLGGRISGVVFTAGGISLAQAESPRLGYGRELVTVLAGPFASISFALLFSCKYGMIHLPLAGMCLSQGLFNLLPAEGLDGGRILTLLLANGGCYYPDRIVKTATLGTLCILAVLGVILLWKSGGNASLLLAGIYAAGSGLSARKPKESGGDSALRKRPKLFRKAKNNSR